MSTHFLLTSAARTISLRDVYVGGEEKAWELFKQMRWPETNGKPVCPRCGHTEAYDIKTRRKHKCKACHHQFSVTSGTILASRKMSYMDLLAAIVIIVNGAKGVSALQLARDLNCQHKTAFVLSHKLREAMASEIKGLTLEGNVEVDGMYSGGHIRPANHKKNRIDRRLARNQSGKRRMVVVARERKGRTLTTVKRSEADGVAFVKSVVANGSEVHADEASHWDALHAKYLTWRINHSEAYSKGGACTNQAESFLARLRKMIEGQHHHVSPQHLHAYASHAAWREDHRREDNGALTKRVAGLAMSHPVSRSWKGYWQRSDRNISKNY
ncbi:MAG: IS1595 family transposase [Pseudomonadota bacterium]